MAWPPSPIADDKAPGPPVDADEHPDHHNELAAAINDTVTELTTGTIGTKIASLGREFRHDWVAPNDYIGTAPNGSLSSASVWMITRMTVAANGNTVSGVATDASWNDRLTEVYA